MGQRGHGSMETMKRPSVTALALAFAALACVVGLVAGLAHAPLAHSAFPGHNGRIAFQSNRDGDYEIFTIRPNGTRVRQLTHNNGIYDEVPHFSPNGKKIVFSSGGSANSWEIVTMRADGTHQRPLTHNSQLDCCAAFSPNGRRIVFVREVGPHEEDEIFVMHADGTHQRRLTHNNHFDFHPVFSPRGGKIAFSSDRNGPPQQVYTMKPDGTHVRQVTHMHGRASQPDFGPGASGSRSQEGELATMRSSRSGRTGHISVRSHTTTTSRTWLRRSPRTARRSPSRWATSLTSTWATTRSSR
jgi:Tol biopolymer transport system component